MCTVMRGSSLPTSPLAASCVISRLRCIWGLRRYLRGDFIMSSPKEQLMPGRHIALYKDGKKSVSEFAWFHRDLTQPFPFPFPPPLSSVKPFVHQAKPFPILGPGFSRRDGSSYFHDFGDKCREIASKLAKFAVTTVPSENYLGSVENCFCTKFSVGSN